jgi:hypothetical protein
MVHSPAKEPHSPVDLVAVQAEEVAPPFLPRQYQVDEPPTEGFAGVAGFVPPDVEQYEPPRGKVSEYPYTPVAVALQTPDTGVKSISLVAVQLELVPPFIPAHVQVTVDLSAAPRVCAPG